MRVCECVTDSTSGRRERCREELVWMEVCWLHSARTDCSRSLCSHRLHRLHQVATNVTQALLLDSHRQPASTIGGGALPAHFSVLVGKAYSLPAHFLWLKIYILFNSLLSKPHENVTPRAIILASNMHQILCQLGLHPTPHWGSLQRSPDPLAAFKGNYF